LHRVAGFLAVEFTLLRKTLCFVCVPALECLRRSLAVLCGHLKGFARIAMGLRLLLVHLLLFLHVYSFR
jgi:hypothetical protein